MSAEANKTIVRRLIESFNEKDMSVIDELVADTYIDHAPFPEQLPGREGMKQAHHIFYSAFPDIHETAEDIIAEGDKVMVRWTIRATHKGKFVGLPPTGKSVTVAGIDIYRIVDGKIVENWHNTDSTGLLYQLGVLPPLWIGVVISFFTRFIQRGRKLISSRRYQQHSGGS